MTQSADAPGVPPSLERYASKVLRPIPSLWPLAIFLVVAFAIGLDLLEDFGDDPLRQVVGELGVAVGLLGGLALLLRQWVRERRARHSLAHLLSHFRAQAHSRSREAERWQAKAKSLLRGLGEAIDDQFCRWGLTAAEREVALLQLKGLSHKEIASVRGTSERTVRQQARAIYSKSGLNGRIELSAFFLEDLLLPMQDAFTARTELAPTDAPACTDAPPHTPPAPRFDAPPRGERRARYRSRVVQ